MELYIVSVTLSAMVLAESPEEARRIANEQGAMDGECGRTLRSEYDYHVAHDLISSGWDGDNLVYHEGAGEVTVERAMEMVMEMVKEGRPP